MQLTVLGLDSCVNVGETKQTKTIAEEIEGKSNMNLLFFFSFLIILNLGRLKMWWVLPIL